MAEDIMCDSCNNMVYDEDDEAYYCDCDMDEDDMSRLISGQYKKCPFYQSDNEYLVVRKQGT